MSTTVDILINATDKASEVMKGVGQSVEGLEGAMKKAEGASMALLGAVTGAVAGTIALGGRAVMQLAEIERISAQTDAVIKSTGGVANVTADEIATMANEMQYLTSMEHEAIREGANLLLTFTNIKNEAGEGNDIFNRTTGIMADLSVAMGQDTKSSATMLGKALNDPTQGMTALSRVGVSFTDEQVKMVKQLQESGDMLGAQNVILDELETQYGGSAEALGGTFTGQLTMAKMAFDDIFQAIMEQLDALDWLQDGLEKVTGTLRNFASSITENGIADTLRKLFPPETHKNIAMIGGAIAVGLIPSLYGMAKAFALSALSILPFLAIGALVGLLAYQIYDNWAFFAPFFSEAFELVKTYVEGFKEAFMMSFEMLMAGLEPLWESAKTMLSSVVPILEIIGAVALILLTTSLAVFGGIVSAIAPLLTAFFNLMDVVINVIMSIISVLTGDFDKASEYWNKATESSIEFFKNLWEAIKAFFIGFANTFIQIFKGFGVDIVQVFVDMFNKGKEKVTSGIDTVLGVITGFGSSFMDAGKGLINGFVDGITGAFGKAKEAVSGGLSAVRKLLPFSPAKEGPLSDLDKSGESFFPTWYEGAMDNVRPMSKAMDKAMEKVAPEADFFGGNNDIALSFTGGGKQTVTVKHEHVVKGEVEVSGDGSNEVVKFTCQEVHSQVEASILDGLRQTVRQR